MRSAVSSFTPLGASLSPGKAGFSAWQLTQRASITRFTSSNETGGPAASGFGFTHQAVKPIRAIPPRRTTNGAPPLLRNTNQNRARAPGSGQATNPAQGHVHG